MSTAHKTAAEYVEHFDDEETLDKKITLLAEWIKSSRYFTAFTGAGISTSTGIPDFRSGMNTVLKTGAGAWTLRAEEEKLGRRVEQSKDLKRVGTLQAIPSHAHMSLVALSQAGLLKFLVSQNTDGLHRRSGFPTAHLAELHGNSNLERCSQCGKEYLRDFHTRARGIGVLQHETGRSCAKCGGILKDTIINFSENLPEKDLDAAFAAAEKSDLCLVLGSSLRVTPAATIPEIIAKKPRGRLVIVNLQATPLDDVAALRINAQIDVVMERVMAKLGLQIPPFVLKRRVQVAQWIVNPAPNVKEAAPAASPAAAAAAASKSSAAASASLQSRVMVRISGIEPDGTPASLFSEVRLGAARSDTEPHQFSLRLPEGSTSTPPRTLEVHAVPYGHYREPAVPLRVTLDPNTISTWVLEFDPVTTGTWTRVECTRTKSGEDARAELEALAGTKLVPWTPAKQNAGAGSSSSASSAAAASSGSSVSKQLGSMRLEETKQNPSQ